MVDIARPGLARPEGIERATLAMSGIAPRQTATDELPVLEYAPEGSIRCSSATAANNLALISAEIAGGGLQTVFRRSDAR